MNLPNGHILQQGKYELTRVVGQGGFGITYRGKWFTEIKGPLGTIKTDVPICVKEYFFKDYCFREAESKKVKVHSETGKILFEKFKEKLIKEAKILSDVSHPYIVNVLEVFEENETAYIVMEYISGCSLKYMLDQNGILPENKVLKYTRQIGEALQFVHENNILHLDIKPSNILIDKDDNARLIDFGVSKRYDIEEQETSTTMLTLSKGFASIEQYDDEGIQIFSPCPDIYSLGATMYNVLTGKTPVESILRATRPLIRPSELNKEITPKTEAVILKAMEILPTNRFQSAREMLNALDIPKEESPKKNPLREVASDSEEDTIMLKGNDETIISPRERQTPEIPQKKKKKRTGIVIALLFLLVPAVAFFVQQSLLQKADNMTETPPPETIDHDPSANQLEPVDRRVTDISSPENTEAENESFTDSGETVTENPVDTETPPSVPVADNTGSTLEKEQTTQSETEKTPSGPTPAEVEANYSKFIASGKKKMDIFDFSGAKKDFMSAKTLRNSEEVEKLLTECISKETEKMISDRMMLYEEKMSFGFYKIVRKKETGKYGAINNRGEETIPCIYIGVGIAENGRSFEREDHLFDIYSSEGELLGEGLTYY